jgi:ATP-dependent HslUV protease subunit HslV
MDKKSSFIVSGDGNVIEPDGPIIAIGSGGGFAHSAATAFLENKKLKAGEIVKKSLKVASDLCIYTNDTITVMEIK